MSETKSANEKAAKAAKTATPKAAKEPKEPKAPKEPKVKEPKAPKAPKPKSKYLGHILRKVDGVDKNPYREGSVLHSAYNTIKSGTSTEKVIETTGDEMYYKYIRRMVRHGNLIAEPRKG